MPSIFDCARHEVLRLRAISRKLSELRLSVVKDETDQLEILVWSMCRKLEQNSRNANGKSECAWDSKSHQAKMPPDSSKVE
jgi:hypothetical protein